jgi:hypothetical protein
MGELESDGQYLPAGQDAQEEEEFAPIVEL